MLAEFQLLALKGWECAIVESIMDEQWQYIHRSIAETCHRSTVRMLEIHIISNLLRVDWKS